MTTHRTVNILLGLLIASPTALHAAEAFPPFSWDKVPVYAHVGKTDDDFTSEQLDFLAKHFDFIAFEKGQAVRKRGDTEAGIAEAAKQIKQRNPRAKVLFYWNAFLDYPLYKASQDFPKGGHLKDHQDKPVMVRGTVPTYDLAHENVRKWWSDAAAAGASGSADGIFADALLQVITPSKRKLLGEGKFQELNKGLVEMLKETRGKLPPDKLIIYNGLRGSDGAQFLPLTSGAMIEHFGHFSGAGKDEIAEDLDSMRTAAKAGKIVCVKAWPGFSFQDTELLKKPHAELAKLAQERIMFPLACFLVAAEPNCYFCYTWGYRENDGAFDWYPEFDKPLGPPQGEAKRTGYSYQREFAHASVFVNLVTKNAKIDWK